MLDQESQIALVAETPVMKAVMTGKKLAILGLLGESFGDFLIVGRKDRCVKKSEYLRGKTITVELGISAGYSLDTALTDHGAARGEAEIISRCPPITLAEHWLPEMSMRASVGNPMYRAGKNNWMPTPIAISNSQFDVQKRAWGVFDEDVGSRDAVVKPPRMGLRRSSTDTRPMS